MEPRASKHKSVFDIIEERSEHPEQFAWTKDAAKLAYQAEEFLHKGELATLSASDEVPKKRPYVLTLQALIRYKVRDH